jgi:hypothetical protein
MAADIDELDDDGTKENHGREFESVVGPRATDNEGVSMNRRAVLAMAAVVALVPLGLVLKPAFAAQGCRAQYAITNQWDGGFQGSVSVTNAGDAWRDWSLSFTLPDAGQKIVQGWNGIWAQTGSNVTVSSASWNGAVATGGTLAVGFIGTSTGGNPAPTKFTVNGVACNGDPSGSTPAGTPTKPATTPADTPPATPSTTPSAPSTTPTPSDPPKPDAGASLAFPGAVGFGAPATGGRGGTVYHVTNLDDSGAGSFRDAVSAGPRVVVFDVGGYVQLKDVVSVKSNITIAGQTAPGQGIGIMGREVSFSNSSNVIVRNIRFRQGDLDPNTKKSGINLNNSSNMIFDHVSIEFALWNNIDAVGAKNITFQNSIDADPIGQQFSAHTETGPYTWYNNLFANSHNRNPLAKANTQYINNVVYNYQAGYTAGNSSGHFTHDLIGNYFIIGPRTTNASNALYQTGNQAMYLSGNAIDKTRDGVLNGTALGVGGGATALTSPWSPATRSIPARSAADAYAYVIAHAGALPHDQVDTHVLADVTSLGTKGDLWKHQADNGLGNLGYGTIAGGAAPADTDRDGIPNDWETKHGLNPGSAADATTTGASGYTNIELYINSLIPG